MHNKHNYVHEHDTISQCGISICNEENTVFLRKTLFLEGRTRFIDLRAPCVNMTVCTKTIQGTYSRTSYDIS